MQIEKVWLANDESLSPSAWERSPVPPGNSSQHPCHALSLAGMKWILVQQLRFLLLSQLPEIQEAPSMASTSYLCVIQISLLYTGSGHSSYVLPVGFFSRGNTYKREAIGSRAKPMFTLSLFHYPV